MADPEILSDDPLRDRYEEIKEREEREAARTILTHGLHVLFKVAVAAVFVMALFYGMRWAYRFGYSIFTTPRNSSRTALPGAAPSLPFRQGSTAMRSCPGPIR